MGELAGKLGSMDAVPPALRYRIRTVLGGTVARDGLVQLLDDGEPWLGADPGLAEVGSWLLDARHAIELRGLGCRWLAMFPSVATATRLAAVALDPTTPAPVRERAIESLGDRQLRGRHRRTQWPAEAVQIADEALAKLAELAMQTGKLASEPLLQALRHTNCDAIAAVFARAPCMWGDALECFATPPLARVLLVSLDDLPAQHWLRVVRLVGATLGEEAVPMLLARAPQAPPDAQLEILFLAVSLGGERYVAQLDAALQGTREVARGRERAKWHLANRGVVPTVRGLRVARVTATMPDADRAARCSQAADDLGALTAFARHSERYLYTLWGWMVRGSGDPARARELVAVHGGAQRAVGELVLEDLARRGRVTQLISTAHGLGAVELGALQLAIWGRPLAALELAATAHLHSAELVCARALACYRAGRPDLTDRILAEDLPAPELSEAALGAFPGAHERWLVEHAAASRPAVTALAAGRAGVLALAKPAPFDAEPDRPSIDSIAAVERRLARELREATVYLAGELEPIAKRTLIATLDAAGARQVTGPIPGTDFYVEGDGSRVQTIAQLERHGARRLRGGTP